MSVGVGVGAGAGAGAGAGVGESILLEVNAAAYNLSVLPEVNAVALLDLVFFILPDLVLLIDRVLNGDLDLGRRLLLGYLRLAATVCMSTSVRPPVRPLGFIRSFQVISA